MVVFSQYATRLLGDTDDPEEFEEVDVESLTAIFFFINFLCTTQDVALDGWALSMLKPQNVGYFSTCQNLGSTVGGFIGYLMSILLEGYGFLNLGHFLLFFGIIILISTTLLAIFKKEKNPTEDYYSGPGLGIVETYKIIWKMISHPLIRVTILFILTSELGFMAWYSITNLKIIETGARIETLAVMDIPLVLIKILFILFVTRFTVGPRPMNVWLVSYPFGLLGKCSKSK